MELTDLAIRIPIAHSGKDESRRNVRYDIDSPYGWQKLIDEHVNPWHYQGVPLVQFHNPGGQASSDKRMRFSQFSLARKAGLNYLNDFSYATNRLIHDGMEVIAYIGNPDDELQIFYEEYPEAKTNPHTSSTEYLRQWALQEIKPITDAGCRLFLDGASGADKDSLSYFLLYDQQITGKEPGLEWTPLRDSVHLHKFHNEILYRSFHPRHILQNNNRDKQAPKLGTEPWYKGTTYIIFRNTTIFRDGRQPNKFSLWHDSEPVIDWWHEIRELGNDNPNIKPMFDISALKNLIEKDYLKEL